jgi:VanZ family protein
MQKTEFEPAEASGESDGVRQLMRFLFLSTYVLLIVGFLYGSSIPLIFSIDDLSTRLLSMFRFSDWDTLSDLVFDTIINVLCFFPIGFAGGALCDLISQPRTFGARTFGIVVGLSFAISLIAEGVQLCIPLRTPSLRDVLTLEAGGVLGACAWWAISKVAIEFICGQIRPVAQWGGGRIFRYRWQGLFALLLVACFLLNLYSSPTELFVTYSRHLSVNDPRMNAEYAWLFDTPRPPHSVWTAIVTSFLSSAGLISACGLADAAIPR